MRGFVLIIKVFQEAKMRFFRDRLLQNLSFPLAELSILSHNLIKKHMHHSNSLLTHPYAEFRGVIATMVFLEK